MSLPIHPEDSTLRRHAEQMQAAMATASASPAQASIPASPAAATAPAAQTPPQKGGFFGWLSRLFGG